jgi:hypothetical protein
MVAGWRIDSSAVINHLGEKNPRNSKARQGRAVHPARSRETLRCRNPELPKIEIDRQAESFIPRRFFARQIFGPHAAVAVATIKEDFMRAYNALALTSLLPGLSHTNDRKTYAAWPVWSGSCRDEVRFAPMSRKQATRLYHKARAWNRRKAAARYGGSIGSAALRVLESLIFDFLNHATGRLDPSYQGLSRKTGLSRSCVAVALARLKTLGIINWLRRCTEGRDESGRFRLRQQTNAYAILPPTQWADSSMAEEPPHPTEWGAAPALPALVDQAIAARQDGASIDALATLLGGDPDDELAAALASLGRTINTNTQGFYGVQNLD